MNEWGVVSVIVVLTGLIASVSGPMLKLNSTITKLTTKMDNFASGLENFQGRYKDHLKNQEGINKETEKKLDDHETRITVIEATTGIRNAGDGGKTGKSSAL